MSDAGLFHNMQFEALAIQKTPSGSRDTSVCNFRFGHISTCWGGHQKRFFSSGTALTRVDRAPLLSMWHSVIRPRESSRKLTFSACKHAGGWLFADKTREARAVTMLDPFQQYYGPWIAVLLCIPAVCGEVFWTASNLSALGGTRKRLMQFAPQRRKRLKLSCDSQFI
ncbi:hypothetical protein HPB48_012608 [Haemaphysalis longicornis]|uniref:Uncharacterized protein n=1 Tax=Haemaphysalis longicornis TaxID=44386 RepID=A0A9J6FQI1_HAELO|nr:hypothetical protein HPB48_012608 [Haemaphysalis longicornis]